MVLLLLGLAIFIGAHVFVEQREARARLIAHLGEGPYKGLFSLVALIGFALIVYGFGSYRATGWVDVWTPPRWTRHVTALLMWFSIIALFAAYLPGRIKLALKHPMLAALKLWALAHLITNGDLGSMILFGSLLAYAVYDRIALKKRGDNGFSGPVTGWGGDTAAVAVGTLAYLAIGYTFHPLLIGVPAFG
ncbi:NnrU protein [Variibacter gotjawalensis]|uniref:NnrU protein n=1 Tax=Variibacter gotjawalensis TaxID=1333996 RepID=A0A0S3PXB7_9BRAD|nr:NnrU family protein [Variibacter gotjawalensis]NIK46389.1 putative membrane protein [Variibacter gotjawalensis]RZS48299.1 putative membrane protein [Variibacter gotjawalensis]BAT60559.1 NnrU protein [Variibacter gotjawalensis]